MSWYNPVTWFRDTVQTNVFHADGKINGEYFLPIGAEEYFFNIHDEKSFLRAFNECPPLKSIILKRARAFNTGKMEVVKTTESQSIVKNGDIVELLNKPNALQTNKQFFAQQNIYIDVFGWCPVLKIRPAGMSNVTSVWNIPPWLFDLEYTGNWIKQNKLSGIYKNYVLYWQGGKVELNFDDVFFIFDDCIGTQDDTNLTIPDSRMVSQEYPINNIIGAYRSLNTMISKRGAIGILSNDSKPDAVGPIALSPEDKDQLQKDWSQYGITGQLKQIIITNANLKWQAISVPIKDMMFYETLSDSVSCLCDAYGVQPELLAQTGKANTYENKKYARKDLYSNTIIPESEQRMEQFTAGIKGEEDKITIRRNFEDIDVLQEDRLTQYQAEQAINNACMVEYNSGIITKNDWRQRLGLKPVTEDPTFDEYKQAVTDNGITQEN